MFAAAVIEVAARLFVEWMNQESAGRVTGFDHASDRLEVLPRLLVVPRLASGRYRLQSQWRAGTMARDAPGVAGTLGQEDRLHAGLEEVEIERCRCGWSSGRLLASGCSQRQKR
jgi:hypothetical protein